jgi:hypothetical protein
MSGLLQSRNGKIGGAVAGFLLVIAAGWFLLVSPQRSKAEELDTSISEARSELSQRRIALGSPSVNVKVKPGDLYRLTKALPSSTDIAGIVLDVNRLAGRNKLELRSIAPSGQQAGTGYTAQPLGVVVQGRFGDISRFLGDLRSLVGVRKGRLDARGRLYSVSGVDLTEPDTDLKFPVVKATVTINAYTFSAPAPTPDTSTTSAPSAGGTVAAGATP